MEIPLKGISPLVALVVTFWDGGNFLSAASRQKSWQRRRWGKCDLYGVLTNENLQWNLDCCCEAAPWTRCDECLESPWCVSSQLFFLNQKMKHHCMHCISLNSWCYSRSGCKDILEAYRDFLKLFFGNNSYFWIDLHARMYFHCQCSIWNGIYSKCWIARIPISKLTINCPLKITCKLTSS